MRVQVGIASTCLRTHKISKDWQPRPGAPSPTASTEPSNQHGPSETGGPGTYAFRSAGIFGQVEIPVSATDPRLAEYETYRKAAGAPEVTYALVTIDNQSDKSTSPSDLKVVTQDGGQVDFEPIDSLVSNWQHAWSSGGPKEKDANSTSMYNQGVALSKKSVQPVLPAMPFS